MNPIAVLILAGLAFLPFAATWLLYRLVGAWAVFLVSRSQG